MSDKQEFNDTGSGLEQLLQLKSQPADPAKAAQILNLLGSLRDEVKRLVLLDILQRWSLPATIIPLSSYLQDRDPLVVRGVAWALGAIGGQQAARILLGFVSSPAGRILRPELVEEALALALRQEADPQALLAAWGEEDASWKRYLRHLTLSKVKHIRFSVYPAPDYLGKHTGSQKQK